MKRLWLISLVIALLIVLAGGLILTSCAQQEEEEEEEEKFIEIKGFNCCPPKGVRDGVPYDNTGNGPEQWKKNGDVDGDGVDDYKWNKEFTDKKGNNVTLWCVSNGDGVDLFGLRWNGKWVGQCPYCGGCNRQNGPNKIEGTWDEFTGTSWISKDDNVSGSAEESDDGDTKVDKMKYEYDAKKGKVKWTHEEDDKPGEEGANSDEVDPPTDSPGSLPAKGTGTPVECVACECV